ncbi:MAG: hypothetical protein ACK4QW_03635 [Alphaproteobacteria bacterium]
MTARTVSERIAMDQLEPQWRRLGYTLIREPSADQLPDFLSASRPDAIGVGKSPGLVIAVAGRRDRSSETRLNRMRALLDGRPDWRLVVVYAAPENVAVEPASPAGLEIALAEADRLAVAEPRPALLLAWAALEAAARARHPDLAPEAIAPSTLLDVLLSSGDLPQDVYEELRETARMRNAIAHGQLDLTPPREAVARLTALARTVGRVAEAA